MTPTDFEFTVTMPGDVRLIGAVRQLAAQAADYAQLNAEAGEGLAGHVERATQTAIASAVAQHAPVHVRFTANQGAVDVFVSYDAAASAATPPDSSAGGVTVDWTAEGSRRTCHIRRPLSA